MCRNAYYIVTLNKTLFLGPGDFVPLSESLSFGPSPPLIQCRSITINLDSILEGFEMFSVAATLEGSPISGSPSNLFIQNSDSKSIRDVFILDIFSHYYHSGDSWFL